MVPSPYSLRRMSATSARQTDWINILCAGGDNFSLACGVLFLTAVDRGTTLRRWLSRPGNRRVVEERATERKTQRRQRCPTGWSPMCRSTRGGAVHRRTWWVRWWMTLLLRWKKKPVPLLYHFFHSASSLDITNDDACSRSLANCLTCIPLFAHAQICHIETQLTQLLQRFTRTSQRQEIIT